MVDIVGWTAVVHLHNITLPGGKMRRLGNIECKPLCGMAVGVIECNGSSGFASVDENGLLACFSKTSGDFSGQIFFAVR